VSISLATFGSQSVYILGAVNNPGAHQLEGHKNLFEILSLAGGSARTRDIRSMSLARSIPAPFRFPTLSLTLAAKLTSPPLSSATLSTQLTRPRTSSYSLAIQSRCPKPMWSTLSGVSPSRAVFR
jgi:protein involved in polysaccharide export with SLBB domain